MSEPQNTLFPVTFSKLLNTDPRIFHHRLKEKSPLKRFEAKLASVTLRNGRKIGRKTKIFETKAEKLKLIRSISMRSEEYTLCAYTYVASADTPTAQELLANAHARAGIKSN
jgi:hypothetical protein